MSLIQAVILGIVQGTTEFVPVSSSGHLVLLPYLLGWKQPSVVFDVLLHAGTLLALLVYFRSEVIQLLNAFLASIKERDIQKDFERKLAWLIIIGTLPAVVMALLFKDFFENLFELPFHVSCFLIVTGAILWSSERMSSKNRALNKINLTDSLIIGFAQGLAIAPGISRSGATISCGLLRGFKREVAARYSFLLSIPIIFAATANKTKDLILLSQTNTALSINYFFGFVAAFISGYLCIKYLLKFLQKGKLNIFAYYCFAIGIISMILTYPR